VVDENSHIRLSVATVELPEGTVFDTILGVQHATATTRSG
jgi:hypothetical protein